MTVLVVAVVVATVAVVVVFAVNRLIDASTRPAKPGVALALPASVTPCPRCSGPLSVTEPDAGDVTQLVGRADCRGCGLRLELTAP